MKELKEKISEIKSKCKVWVNIGNEIILTELPINELKEQDINPNTMPAEMFRRLVKNIKRKGQLEEFPYCAITEKGVEIISGHHRVRAAREAGLKEIPIILDISGLSRDEIISKQISHNTIKGFMDFQLTQRLYEKIKDADERLAAYFKSDEIKIDENVNIIDLNPDDLDYRAVYFLFLPHQIKQFDDIIMTIQSNSERVYMAEYEDWEKLKEIIKRVRKAKKILSIGAILSYMCDIVEEKLNEEKDGEKGEA